MILSMIGQVLAVTTDERIYELMEKSRDELVVMCEEFRYAGGAKSGDMACDKDANK